MKYLSYILFVILSLFFSHETQAYNKSFANKIISDYFNNYIFDRKYFIDSLPNARSKNNYKIEIDNILYPIKKDKSLNKYIHGLSRKINIVDCNEEDDINENLIAYAYINTIENKTSSSIEFYDLSLLGLSKKMKIDSKPVENFIKNIILKYSNKHTTNSEYRDDKLNGILYVPVQSNISLEIKYKISTNEIYLVKINRIS